MYGGLPANTLLDVFVSHIFFLRPFAFTDHSRHIHAYLTNHGEAMHKIQSRLRDIMGAGRKTWAEPEKTRKVNNPQISSIFYM